jgi:vancomycin resistance protein VanW
VVRRLLRRWLPFELRLRIALLRRWLRDRRARHAFAGLRVNDGSFVHTIASYERAIPIYPGQEQLAEAKRTNQRTMASALDGALIGPGELFSLWRYAGRPTACAGYARAAAIKDGLLTTDIGGATCLLATVVYNLALLGAMEIVERRCHSVDSYGPRRYFELGRDAAIEFGYTDLRFRNPHPYPVVVRLWVEDERITARLLAAAPRDFCVEIRVSEPRNLQPGRIERECRQLAAGQRRLVAEALPGIVTRTTRIVLYRDGRVRRDDLGESLHKPQPAIVEVGRRSRHSRTAGA